NYLGVCYENGIGVEQNIQKAVKLYQKAAEQGDARALNILGFCYENGTGVEKYIQKAVELYQKAAEQGDADAQFSLGVCYENGTGVEQNIQKAVELYQKAAKQGLVHAQNHLGVCSNLTGLLMENPAEFTWNKRIKQLSTLMRDLQTMHKAGVVHKNFHSGNVLWTLDEHQNYELHIFDFGSIDEKVKGTAGGVLSYMAPEILQGQPKSTASDIYAFGIVMWEFSSGQPAFIEYRDDDVSLFEQIIQ